MLLLLVILFNFEINLMLKPFSYMTKTQDKTFKYLENEKSFSGEIKRIFHRF